MKQKYRVTLDIETDLDGLKPFDKWLWDRILVLPEGDSVTFRASRVLKEKEKKSAPVQNYKTLINDFMLASATAIGRPIIEALRKTEAEITDLMEIRRTQYPTKTEITGEPMTAPELREYEKNPAVEKLRSLRTHYEVLKTRLFAIGAVMRKGSEK